MKILIDICHPAHFHFFKNSLKRLKSEGHEILITSRNKDMTLALLEQEGFVNVLLTPHIGKGILGLLKELIYRNYKLINVIYSFKPDIMTAIGGTFIAQSGLLTKTPSLVFYDTENALMQNLITYPFCTQLYVPQCYSSWTPRNKTTRYAGYHELAYLHPDNFTPSKATAVINGLSETNDTFFLRLVSWQANHDIGESGWDIDLLGNVVKELNKHGKVIISSEASLPAEFNEYLYAGCPTEIHHLLYYCKATITESATMASESAVLGTPALYIAHTARGYIEEQEKDYQLVKILNNFNWLSIQEGIQTLMAKDKDFYRAKHEQLVNEKINVTDFICNEILTFRS